MPSSICVRLCYFSKRIPQRVYNLKVFQRGTGNHWVATAIRSLSQKPGAPSFAHPSQEKNPDPWRVGFIFRISFDFTVHDIISRRLSLSLWGHYPACALFLVFQGGSSLWDPQLCLAQGSVLVLLFSLLPALSVGSLPLQWLYRSLQTNTDFYLQADLSAELWSHRINH